MKRFVIFYVTYRHDLEWFQWSLESVRKNLTGHERIVAVAPEQDRHLFEQIEGVEWHFIPDWAGRGYIWQQWVKMNADQYVGDAEVIVHIDSDVIVKAPCDLNDFLDGDRLPWRFTKYKLLPPDVPWKKITAKWMAWEPENEYMRGFPFLVWVQDYQIIREEVFGTDREMFKAMKETREISEFNIMGVFLHERRCTRYKWIDTEEPDATDPTFSKFTQFWSHSPIATEEMISMFGLIPMLTEFGVWVVPGDTHLSAWIREHKRLDFDVPFLERICKHIKGGDTVVDIGAFVGDHTLAYANMTSGYPGRVFAIEANPLHHACLERNMRPYRHVHCLNGAMGLVEGKLRVVTDKNAGAGYVGGGDGVEVEVAPLDSMALDSCDLIKIDAVGMETDILRGAKQTIERFHPTLVLEINHGALKRAGSSSFELVGLLSALGYIPEEPFDADQPQIDVIFLWSGRDPLR